MNKELIIINKQNYIYLNTISSLKSLMILMVLLYHACIALTGKWGGVSDLVKIPTFYMILPKWLNMVHIQTLTFASGYLFYFLRNEKKKYEDRGKFFRKKTDRLLVPYVVIGLLWVMPASMLVNPRSFIELIKDFVLALNPGQLWFLVMLFQIFLFFYYVGNALMKLNGYVMLVLLYSVNIVTAILAEKLPLGIFQISRTLEFIIYFYFGMFFRKQEKIMERFPIALLGIFHLVTFLIVLFFGNIKINLILSPIVAISGSSFFIGLIRKCSWGGILNSRVYKIIEKNSMGIYLFHQQLLYITMRLFWPIANIAPVFVLFNFLVAGIASIAISELISHTKIGRFLLCT